MNGVTIPKWHRRIFVNIGRIGIQENSVGRSRFICSTWASARTRHASRRARKGPRASRAPCRNTAAARSWVSFKRGANVFCSTRNGESSSTRHASAASRKSPAPSASATGSNSASERRRLVRPSLGMALDCCMNSAEAFASSVQVGRPRKVRASDLLVGNEKKRARVTASVAPAREHVGVPPEPPTALVSHMTYDRRKRSR